MNVLIIGGTSGLGFELAWRLRDQKHDVTVTGRHKPGAGGMHYQELDLSDFDSEACQQVRRELVERLGQVDWLVYAAGFEQQTLFAELWWAEVESQLNVGLKAPMWFCHELMRRDGGLQQLLMVTSTSQWVPRANEAAYCAVKAAEAHFARSLAGEGGVAKVMIAGPSGMRTNFWRNSQRDTSGDMDPGWVADTILKQWADQSEPLRAIKVLGGSTEADWRVEPMEFMR